MCAQHTQPWPFLRTCLIRITPGEAYCLSSTLLSIDAFGPQGSGIGLPDPHSERLHVPLHLFNCDSWGGGVDCQTQNPCSGPRWAHVKYTLSGWPTVLGSAFMQSFEVTHTHTQEHTHRWYHRPSLFDTDHTHYYHYQRCNAYFPVLEGGCCKHFVS